MNNFDRIQLKCQEKDQTDSDIGVLGTLVEFSSYGFHHIDHFGERKKRVNNYKINKSYLVAEILT